MKKGKDPGRSSKLRFGYPVMLSGLRPCAVLQVLLEALQLTAAPGRAAGPHFTVQPAGGRQNPPQHGTAVIHSILGQRHGHVFPQVPHEEIWKEEPRNINTPGNLLGLHLPIFILTFLIKGANLSAPLKFVIPCLEKKRHARIRTVTHTLHAAQSNDGIKNITWKHVHGATEASEMFIMFNLCK